MCPAGLTADHDFAVSTTLLHGSVLAACAWIAGVAAALIYFRKYQLAGYGLLFYLILLAPTSSVVPIKDLVAGHWMYLPIFGLILVAMEGLRRMRVASASAVTAMASILVVLGNVTYERSKDWADRFVCGMAQLPQHLQRPVGGAGRRGQNGSARKGSAICRWQ